MFVGTFQDLSFGEIAKLLVHSCQTGMLELLKPQSAEIIGKVYFGEGKFLAAQADKAVGLDAILKICEIEQSHFIFKQGIPSPSDNLAGYKRKKLLERIEKKIFDLRGGESGHITPQSKPLYLKGKNILDEFKATPDELGVLVHCQGQLTAKSIAEMKGMVVSDVCKSLENFVSLGLVVVL